VRNRNLQVSFLLALALCAACAHALDPVPFQGVGGTVVYLSEPEGASTDWVRVLAYRDLPQSELELLGFEPPSDTLPRQGLSTPFVVALEPGEYAWLVVVWKERGNDNLLEALRAAGWYTASGDAFSAPASFRVEPDSETAGINVIADFANMLTIAEVLEVLP
jgi:hypothetical protein